MRKGDILLVKYIYDPIGWLIRRATHGKWNHVAWALNEYIIVEAKRKGILVSPVTKYLDKRYFKYKLIRIKDINEKKLDRAVTYALKRKRKYSYLKLWISFLMVLFKSDKSLPRPTCSGLIAESLAKVNWYFSSKKPSLITPQNMANSKNVKGITNELHGFDTSL